MPPLKKTKSGEWITAEATKVLETEKVKLTGGSKAGFDVIVPMDAIKLEIPRVWKKGYFADVYYRASSGSSEFLYQPTIFDKEKLA